MADIVCEYDLDPYGRELSNADQELWQDLLHRLIEDPGSNLDDGDRGVGVFSLLSSSTSLQHIAHAIESDFRKDARVQVVKATVGTAKAARITVEVVTMSNSTLSFDVSSGSGVIR